MEDHAGAHTHTDSMKSPIWKQVDVLFRNCGQWRAHARAGSGKELWPVGDTHWRRCVLKDHTVWERTILGQSRSVRKEQQRETVMN